MTSQTSAGHHRDPVHHWLALRPLLLPLKNLQSSIFVPHSFESLVAASFLVNLHAAQQTILDPSPSSVE